MWINRTLCDIVEEMRKCHKTRNYSYLPGLIEEMQSAGNRMEAALSDMSDFEEALDKKKEAEKELKKVKKQLKESKETSVEELEKMLKELKKERE